MWELNYILNDLASMAFVVAMLVYVYGEKALYSLGSRRLFPLMVKLTTAYVLYSCILDFTRVFDPLGIPVWVLDISFSIYILATQALACTFMVYIVADARSNASSVGLDVHSLVVAGLMTCLAMVLLLVNRFTPILYSVVEDADGTGLLVTGVAFRWLFAMMLVQVVIASALVLHDPGFLQPQMRRAGSYARAFSMAFLILQFAFPELQLMSMTFCVLLFFCFVVMTTSTFLVDPTTGLGNAKMLFSSLGYHFSKEGEFCVLSLELVDYDRLVRDLETTTVQDMLNLLCSRLGGVEGMRQVFRIEEDRFVMIGPAPSSRQCRRFVLSVLEVAGLEYEVGPLSYVPRCRIFMIPCPVVAPDEKSVFDMLSYFTPSRIDMLDIGQSYYSVTRERYSFFVCDLKVRRSMERRREIVAMLKKACEEDGFEVAFQPMFDTDGHFIDMAECLVRLYDRRHESYVSPLEFIPVAEAEGYIDQITSSVLHKACILIRHFRSHGHALTLSLNFSSRQIFSKRLLESVSATLAKEGVDPSSIRIEITEDDIIEDYDSVRSMMDEYRRRGIGFLLDDFGSGYAGLTRYINLPFECVKLDRSFLLAAMSNRRSDTLMRALVGCFRLLDYDVVFEGIEDDGQLDYVRSCSGQAAIQGYLFCAPLDASAFCARLSVDPIPQDGPIG